jgi:hypothetical protein
VRQKEEWETQLRVQLPGKNSNIQISPAQPIDKTEIAVMESAVV